MRMCIINSVRTSGGRLRIRFKNDTVEEGLRRSDAVGVHLNEYREVDGVKVPFSARFAFESFDFTIKINDLQHNISIDDAVFKKPGTR